MSCDRRYQFGVCCPECGDVELTEEEYERQIWRFNSTWMCPKCYGKAQWDDTCRETNPPDEEIAQ